MQRYRLPLVREAPIPDDIVLPQPIDYYYLADEVDARIREHEVVIEQCARILRGIDMSKSDLILALQAIKNIGL